MSATGEAYMTEHLIAASIEDTLFLMAAGASFEECCRRVGVAESTLRQRFKRAGVKIPGDDE